MHMNLEGICMRTCIYQFCLLIHDFMFMQATYLSLYSVLVCANAYIIIYSHNAVLVVQEVVSGDGLVLGIAVNDSDITLPAEVFNNKNGPGAC